MLQLFSPLYLWFFTSLSHIFSPPSFSTLVKSFLWNGLALVQSFLNLSTTGILDQIILFRGGIVLCIQDVQQHCWRPSTWHQQLSASHLWPSKLCQPCLAQHLQGGQRPSAENCCSNTYPSWRVSLRPPQKKPHSPLVISVFAIKCVLP